MSSRASGADSGSQGGVERKRVKVCRFWLEGKCVKEDACPFLHEYIPGKIPLCKEFCRTGKCTRPNCRYSHVKPPDCEFYKRGFCRHGDECDGWHKGPNEPPKEICLSYLLGFCPKGPDCKKAQFVSRFSPSRMCFCMYFTLVCLLLFTVPSGRFLHPVITLSSRTSLLRSHSMANLSLLLVGTLVPTLVPMLIPTVVEPSSSPSSPSPSLSLFLLPSHHRVTVYQRILTD